MALKSLAPSPKQKVATQWQFIQSYLSVFWFYLWILIENCVKCILVCVSVLFKPWPWITTDKITKTAWQAAGSTWLQDTLQLYRCAALNCTALQRWWKSMEDLYIQQSRQKANIIKDQETNLHSTRSWKCSRWPEGYINPFQEKETKCMINNNHSTCSYGALTFLVCVFFFILDTYFPQISSAKEWDFIVRRPGLRWESSFTVDCSY